MRSFLIFWLFLLFTHLAQAQIDSYAFGGRALGMGQAVAAQRDAWSIFNNVAGLSYVDQGQAFFAYDNRFNVSAFQTFGLGAVAPLKWGVAGASLSRFGDELYNELKIGLGYSYRIEPVSLGLKVNYLQVSIQDLNSAGTVILEFGGIARITQNLFLAGHVYNLNQAKLTTERGEDQDIPTVLKAGLSYQPVEALTIGIETEKDVDLPASFKAGVEYQVVKNVFLRTGVQTEPFINHFGLGFSPKRFSFDYALSTMSELGLSHHFSLGYRFGRKISRSENTQP